MNDLDHMEEELGGESSCYAHLLCPDCGVVLPTTSHRPSCRVPAPTNPNLIRPTAD